MAAEFPYASKPEDVAKLLKLLPEVAVPEGKLDALYLKALGFTPASARHLFSLLQSLGFLNDQSQASAVWRKYAAAGQRGLVLASALKKAYAELFELVFCPYLEGDEVIFDFLKKRVKGSFRDISLRVQTFRILSELADFQDMMGESEPDGTSTSAPAEETRLKAKVNPNLQLNIQIHIDPATPDEKIEVIFKNLRKYLGGKEN